MRNLIMFEGIGYLLIEVCDAMMLRIISQQFYCVLLDFTVGPNVVSSRTGASESHRKI